jgi:NAD(P)-dependent dehydrogenase (short-subunit alcohol dehydrogenase family)
MTHHPFNLTGKVALITGGNGGIGLGMAQAVARAGAAVCIWGTNADKNAAALDQLRAYGTQVAAYACNVTDAADVNARFQDALNEFGRVDACFANAGVISHALPFTDTPDEEWQRVIATNLDGAFYTLRAATRHMVARAKQGDPGGRLIGTASIAAISGAARHEAYAATKGGLIAMLNALAVELARYGITANALLPGWVGTAMTAPFFESEAFAKAVKPRIPVGRWGDPADFGGIAVYLMSNASAYHTGDTIRIDGGYCLF